MDRVSVNVTTTGGTVTVPGYRVVPGLAVHRAVRARGGVLETGRGWVVTHERSGKGLVSRAVFATRRDAVAAAQDLDHFRWDVDDPAAGLGLEDRQHVVEVLTSGASGRPGFPRPGGRARVAAGRGLGADDMRAAAESFLPDGWALYDGDPFGDLECPCGWRIEPDGVCPDGCRSPMPI